MENSEFYQTKVVRMGQSYCDRVNKAKWLCQWGWKEFSFLLSCLLLGYKSIEFEMGSLKCA